MNTSFFGQPCGIPDQMEMASARFVMGPPA